MPINQDLKKLLPVSMREGKWGEFIEAYQSITTELKEDKIELLVNQFNLSEMTSIDFTNLINRFSFSLSTYEGWTEELEYLKRQALTIVSRILFKNTRKAYKNEFYIFNIWGDVYPLARNVDTSLSPQIYWWSSDENPVPVSILDSADDNLLYYIYYTLNGLFQLDSGQTLNEKYGVYGNPKESGLSEAWLDTPNTIRTLDEQSQIDYLERQILINYFFKRVENVNEFLSTNTMRAYYNDCNQIKRKTERIYFEPVVEIKYNNTSVTTTPYDTFDQTDIAYQTTILSGDLFNTFEYMVIGNGSYDAISGIVSGVISPVETVYALDMEITEDGITEIWAMRKNLFDKAQVEDFSEVALYDNQSGCFLYSQFPYVRYHADSYSNFQFTFENLAP